MGGFALAKDKLQERIVEAARRIPAVRARIGTMKNQLVHIEKKAALVTKEQKRVVELRERIETTISDLKLKKVVDGERGIKDALNAINDAMGSLGFDYDYPSIADIMAPDHKTSVAEEFQKIMAE